MGTQQIGYLLTHTGYQYDDQSYTMEEGVEVESFYHEKAVAETERNRRNLVEIRGRDDHEWSEYFWEMDEDSFEEAMDFYNDVAPGYVADGDTYTEWNNHGEPEFDFSNWPDDVLLAFFDLLPVSFYNVESVKMY